MPPASRLGSKARWIPLGALVLVVVVVLATVLNSSTPSVGYDISYPQCSTSYPSHPLFGVVGVNGGLASDANPCLNAELRWTLDAPEQRRQKQVRLSLYMDTGNPGAHHVSDWPGGGTTSDYGSCNGLLTNACSYLYGEQRAAYSYHLVNALDPVAARTAPWWLDVEQTESWAGTYELNVAALQGYIAGLDNAGAAGPIGIYSTGAQWTQLTGLTAQTTASAFKRQLLDWVAGTDATLAQARQNCANGGFTGAAPTLAQYQDGSFDADLRCSRTRREVR